jgi:hypothetical protein
MLPLHVLMSLICNTNCAGTQQPPEKYDDGCTDIFRKYGANHLIFIACDYQFTDMLSPAEWTAAIAAGDIHITPAGMVIPQDPTAATFVVEGCGREALGEVEQVIDFETYQTSADLADHVYYKEIFNNSRSYRVMWIDCNDIFYMETDWAAEAALVAPATIAGSNPGFTFSLSGLPAWVAGENQKGKWKFQIKIKTNAIAGAALLPGVSAVLA